MNPCEHGAFGSDPANFVRCLPKQPNQPSDTLLEALAGQIMSLHDTLDAGPDPEENMFVPAGFTYFGQFIDHDLTFDTTSTFDGVVPPSNFRTPRLDLDCVYGRGPLDEPFMYDPSGAFLIEGDVRDPVTGRKDLPRNADDRAIIGDPRNDENSIVSQIQAGMIRFHNNLARKISVQTGLAGFPLFHAARNQVRWCYQRIIVEDYLPRIVNKHALRTFDDERMPNSRGLSKNTEAYLLYKPENRAALPLEFGGSIYRFGHSMVRNGYVMQGGAEPVAIFVVDNAEDSLVGAGKVIQQHIIQDWRRFFPDSEHESLATGETVIPAPGTAAGIGFANVSPADTIDAPRLQFAYRIDASVVFPLAHLPASVASDPPPSLILRNLRRGKAFLLPSGQELAKAARATRLEDDCLAYRVQVSPVGAEKKQFQYKKIDPALVKATPLWFYILAEAQRPLTRKFGLDKPFDESELKDRSTEFGVQLDGAGGRLMAEVFNALLDSEAESYRNHVDAAHWTPPLAKMRMWDLLHFA